tara:strand:- start:44 stop:1117 length:1074 start_codon:yes stop_codon:yes gene_type:complete
MDYINYVKQYPMMGQIGLGGGACSVSRFSAGGEPVPDGSTYFGDRAMIAGGATPSSSGGVNNVEIKNITSSANSSDFGDLLNSRYSGAGVSDSVRGIVAGGRDGSGVSVDMIQYHVIPVQGESAIDFGNLISARWAMSAAGDGTRAIFHGGGGSDPAHMTSTTQCQKITTQTLGNATAVGSISTAKMMTFGGSNGTRGILAGGTNNGSPTNTMSRIDYYTMATFSSGEAAEFGSLSTAFTHGTGTNSGGSASNTSRFLFMCGGYAPSGGQSVSQQCVYINIATTGNASDFGDNEDQRRTYLAGFNNATRGGFGGGYFNNYVDNMKYFTIASTGNASGFGDLGLGAWGKQAACSGAAS